MTKTPEWMQIRSELTNPAGYVRDDKKFPGCDLFDTEKLQKLIAKHGEVRVTLRFSQHHYRHHSYKLVVSDWGSGIELVKLQDDE